jgi:hypothetical protein
MSRPKDKTSGPLSPHLESALVVQIARKHPAFSATCVQEEFRRRSGREVMLQRVRNALDEAGIDRPVTPPAPRAPVPADPPGEAEAAEPPAPAPADEPPPGFRPGDVVSHEPDPDVDYPRGQSDPVHYPRGQSNEPGPPTGADDHDRELDAMRAVKDALKGLPKPAARRAVGWATQVLGIEGV